MGPFHIIFILVNMAIPSWVYMRSADTKDTPRLKWDPWEENMERIVDVSGGFEDCSNADVVRYLRELCEKSMERWTEQDSVILERASSTVLFSCEVRSDATFVQWRLEETEDFDIKCQPGRNRASVGAAPAFVFDQKGALSAIEFSARNGERQSVNAANCRRKLQLTLDRKVRTDTQAVVDKMPRLKSDPIDWVMANRMCFEYDVTSEWEPLRETLAR